ncbi:MULTISPECIES: peptidase inhibitor family I36 protein [unclassified Streptomyces]|uniref:peptidase inhibitor family I36 protein n=1 Tax=unclassified Streptomyces TaxID=2593676 RepID=UPI001660AFC9|nr:MULTISPECIES: peptidase inhibitor family I36 protein [unclassified Streptomyces]MBD0710842.1 hypothetical protein [Streptomyces sp. CBMA291]MBD0717744.1 hypothetical protein [Streptomyces sp. CBMA370]
MFKRSLAALGTAAGLAVAALAIAPAAQAAPAGCASGGLCAYYTSGYTGNVQTVFQDNADLTMYANFYNIQGGSLYNNGQSCSVRVYTGKGGTGAGYALNRGTGWSTIGSNLPHISSNYWC